MDNGIFNLRINLNACDCTRRRSDTVRESSCLWQKNPLPHRGIEPASTAYRSDALPTELHSHPTTLGLMRPTTPVAKWIGTDTVTQESNSGNQTTLKVKLHHLLTITWRVKQSSVFLVKSKFVVNVAYVMYACCSVINLSWVFE